MKKLLAEGIGTMVLVSMGCGAAVLNGGPTSVAVVLTIAFAFGLSVVAMTYTIGGISGCHINPAIMLGVWLADRMNDRETLSYMAAQVAGAIVGSAILYAIASGMGLSGTGANTYGAVRLVPAFAVAAVFTFIFVLVVPGTTDSKKGAGNLAGLAIGLTLGLVRIVCIPVTGASVAPAVFAGGEALSQLWFFIAVPFVGAALSAGVCKCLTRREKTSKEIEVMAII